MQQVTLAEAAENLTNLVEAALKGEEVVILKGDRPVVKLAPMEPVKRRPQFGSAKGLIAMK